MWPQTAAAPYAAPVESPPAPANEQPAASTGLGSDIKAYFTAPLRWDQSDWAWFGGALAATALAHHYDTDVRKHFTMNLAPGRCRAMSASKPKLGGDFNTHGCCAPRWNCHCK